MAYQYDEPIRTENGVLFRVHDHAQHSYLFKVEQRALEDLYDTSLGKKNPVEPTDRGYPSEHVFRHVEEDRPFNVVDAYNHHRELIHQAAVSLIDAKATGEPITITTDLLNKASNS